MIAQPRGVEGAGPGFDLGAAPGFFDADAGVMFVDGVGAQGEEVNADAGEGTAKEVVDDDSAARDADHLGKSPGHEFIGQVVKKHGAEGVIDAGIGEGQGEGIPAHEGDAVGVGSGDVSAGEGERGFVEIQSEDAERVAAGLRPLLDGDGDIGGASGDIQQRDWLAGGPASGPAAQVGKHGGGAAEPAVDAADKSQRGGELRGIDGGVVHQFGKGGIPHDVLR